MHNETTSRLTRALKDYLDDRPGELSVAVRDLSTGADHSYGDGLRTATASIVKVEILAALLLRAQRAGRGLTAHERSLAAQMIRKSDNAATTSLWNEIGGGTGLTAVSRRLGLTQTICDPGGAWGATTTSARDQIRLLTALTSTESPLTAAHRGYALDLMGSVEADQTWGVSAAAGPGDDVALKNGWLPRAVDGGAWTINSIGRITRDGGGLLIAVISRGHPGMGTGIETVEGAAALVSDGLEPRGEE